jgi:hypothetical protein
MNRSGSVVRPIPCKVTLRKPRFPNTVIQPAARYSANVTSGIFAARCTSEDATELYYRQFVLRDNETFEIAIRFMSNLSVRS